MATDSAYVPMSISLVTVAGTRLLCNRVWVPRIAARLCCLLIFVDETAESISSEDADAVLDDRCEHRHSSACQDRC